MKAAASKSIPVTAFSIKLKGWTSGCGGSFESVISASKGRFSWRPSLSYPTPPVVSSIDYPLLGPLRHAD
jgi:hypothetical protein